jgi:3-oxoacyl-(acyl-carrier-protein) synthase
MKRGSPVHTCAADGYGETADYNHRTAPSPAFERKRWSYVSRNVTVKLPLPGTYSWKLVPCHAPAEAAARTV